MTNVTEDARLTRLTELCLALPEVNREAMGPHATFLVRGKRFVYYLDDHHGAGRVGVCCRVAAGLNEARIESDPARFYMPAYIGPRGWVGLRLDLGTIDWDEVEDLVTGSYRMIAPRRLATLV